MQSAGRCAAPKPIIPTSKGDRLPPQTNGSGSRPPSSAPVVEPTAALASMTVAKLKAEAKCRGLKVSGKKAELLARIVEYDHGRLQNAAVGTESVTEAATESVPTSAMAAAKDGVTEEHDSAAEAEFVPVSRSQQLALLTIQELKELLRRANLKVSGTKPALIERCLENKVSV
jgi:hypothetical protein